MGDTRSFAIAGLATLFAVGVAGAANAGTITNADGSLTTSFTDGPAGNVSLSSFSLNNAAIVVGSNGNQAAPFIYGLGAQSNSPYIAIYGGGTATLSLGTAANAFGLTWGSVDTYNTITFKNGNSVVATFTGSDVVAASSDLTDFTILPGNGAGGNWLYGGTVYAQIDTAAYFNTVVLSSSSNSFEFSNGNVSPVPLPGGLSLFGAGLVGVGLIAWKRKKTV
jgi:hypothetical protein